MLAPIPAIQRYDQDLRDEQLQEPPMYTVEDETFQRARAIVVALADELDAQQAAGSRHPIDIHGLVLRSTRGALPADGEAVYLHALADKLQKSFPISELFPRKRRADRDHGG